MNKFEKELEKVQHEIVAAQTVEPVTIRTFLSWFDMYRRTRWNVDFIDRELSKRRLITVPNYKDAWVDAPMTFAARSADGEDQTDAPGSDRGEPPPEQPSLTEKFGEDPTYKIGKLRSANKSPLSVAPDALLEEVTTHLFANGYSQLPVMQGSRDVKGVISWKSIGIRISQGVSSKFARDYMEPHAEVLSSSSIFEAIRIIVINDYVLVRNAMTKQISGIVTASDLCEQFEDLSTPFLLISEIEINIRNLIENSFDADSLRDFFGKSSFAEKQEIKSEKLTFGHYVLIMQNPDLWEKIGLKLDRKAFCIDLERVRDIRNDVMHFASDPIQKIDLDKIRGISKLLDTLRSIAT